MESVNLAIGAGMEQMGPDATFTSLIQLFVSITTAYQILGKNTLAVGEVVQSVKDAISKLIKECGQCDDLLTELLELSTECRKLDIEMKSHIRTVKEQARRNIRIIENARREMWNKQNIFECFGDIEKAAEQMQKGSEELKKKCGDLIGKVTKFCGTTKAGYLKNSNNANFALKSGLVTGVGAGYGAGIFAAWQVATKGLCVFGVPGAIAGGFLGWIGGSIVGAMVGSIPIAAGALIETWAKQFKVLDEKLSELNEILFKRLKVLTEICRLSNILKMTHARDENMKNNVIAQEFDLLTKASARLENNCDIVLQDKRLSKQLDSLKKECSKNSTKKKKLN